MKWSRQQPQLLKFLSHTIEFRHLFGSLSPRYLFLYLSRSLYIDDAMTLLICQKISLCEYNRDEQKNERGENSKHINCWIEPRPHAPRIYLLLERLLYRDSRLYLTPYLGRWQAQLLLEYKTCLYTPPNFYWRKIWRHLFATRITSLWIIDCLCKRKKHILCLFQIWNKIIVCYIIMWYLQSNSELTYDSLYLSISLAVKTKK